LLRLTDEAATRVRELAAMTRTTSAGLRIAVDRRRGHAMRLSFTAGPVHGDCIVEDDGARVFLEPTAASVLEGKVLGVVDRGAGLAFVLSDEDHD
jgi:iron-sulfur cluster assembly protein